MAAAPFIEKMQVFYDLSSQHVVDTLVAVTAPYAATLTPLPTSGKTCFTEMWESGKGDYWPVVKCTVHPLKQFECFVTDKEGPRGGDVTYALHCRCIPVLSLVASEDTSSSDLYHSMRSLNAASPDEALAAFFVFAKEPGRVFVLEGGDGAGKQTQTTKLVERLRAEGRNVQQLDFPNDSARYGVLIRELLAGKYGNLRDINPMMFASLYSLNRHDTLPRLRLWLQRGCNVILDRYMTANFGYQASKYPTDEERKAAIECLKVFETRFLSLPPPHRVIYLDLPPKVAYTAMLADSSRRELDLHELAGLEYKEKVRSAFLWCCEAFEEWRVVRCTDAAEVNRFSREEIHNEIYSAWENEFV